MTTDSVQSSTVCSSTTPNHASSSNGFSGDYPTSHQNHHAHGPNPIVWDHLANSELGYELAATSGKQSYFMQGSMN